MDGHTVSFWALYSTCLCTHLPLQSLLSKDLEAPKEKKWLWVMPWGLWGDGGGAHAPQTAQKEKFFLSITSLRETVVRPCAFFPISLQACPGHRSRKGRLRKPGLALSCPVTQPGDPGHHCSVLWSVGWKGCADEAACLRVLSDGRQACGCPQVEVA